MGDFEKLRVFIEKKGFTTASFGKTVGVSINYFANLKSSNGVLSMNTLSKISESFPDFDVVGFVVCDSVEEWLRCISDPPPARFWIKTKLQSVF